MDTMGQDHGKMKAFDLFRNSLKDVRIITFDELFEKVRVMIELLQGGDSPAVAKNDETEIPF